MNYAHSKTKQNGYTLAEIIVTTIILGILGTLALPNFTAAIEKTKIGEGVQILETLRNAQNLYKFETGDFANGALPSDFSVAIPNQLKNFNFLSILLNNPLTLPGKVAEINRTGDLYILEIDNLGHVACTSTTPGLCAKIGY